MFEGFDAIETRRHKKVNNRRIELLKCHEGVPVMACGENISSRGPALPGATKWVSFNRKTESSAEDHRGTQKATKLQNSGKVTRASPAYGQPCIRISGLVNLGNTCYMNSIMQCLRSVPLFAKYFTEDTYM